MKMPAKLEYALRAAMELSLHYRPGVPIQIAVIAKAQGVPKNFLLQLLIHLKHAGIVESARGVSGGYSLARHPSQIKVADVVRAIDESIVNYQKAPKPGKAPDSARAVTTFWNEINREVISRLEGISFEELVLRIKTSASSYEI